MVNRGKEGTGGEGESVKSARRAAAGGARRRVLECDRVANETPGEVDREGLGRRAR